MAAPRDAQRRTRRSGARSPALSWAATGLGAAAIAAFSFGPAAGSLPLFTTVVLASIAATVAGTLLHQPRGMRGPWWAVVGAEVVFFTGAVLRSILPGAADSPPRPMSLIPNGIVVPGYLMLGYSLYRMLQRRRAGEDITARADAILIGIGTALTGWIFLVEPYLGSGEIPTAARALTSTLPIFDVLLLVVVSQLVLADGTRKPALWMISMAANTVFVGDLLFAWRDADHEHFTPPLRLMYGLFLAGYVLMGSATLHPTMRTLTEPQRVTAHRLGAPRTASIAVVLMLPIVLATAVPPATALAGAVRLSLSALLIVTVTGRVVSANNSRAAAERTARHRASHDTLTELPNRDLLVETIDGWYRDMPDGAATELLFVDLDRFKAVNDTWGHHVGDELLCAVAGRLAEASRRGDLICRVGGDEFAVALRGPRHAPPGEPLANRLIGDISRPYQLSVGEVIVTPSIGIASSRDAGDALELLRNADTAMYRAKHAGRNGYACYDAALPEDSRRRVRYEQALRGALERGELQVVYQPIIDLATDELSGFEALMRWQHPEFGQVSPLDFIPIAEETGLIVASGAWLLDEAATQLATWRAQRAPDRPQLHISVNISYRQLQDSALVDVVRGVLARSGLPPSALWLEITESGMMADPDRALATMSTIRDLGVTLCLDDFGTGYSSLSHLKRFPVGIIKIDRSFIPTITAPDDPADPAAAGGDGTGDKAIVHAVLAISRTLGRRVVAEGVETAAQRDWLRGLGCDLAQGWFYGAGRPADQQGTWIERVVDPVAVAGQAPEVCGESAQG